MDLEEHLYDLLSENERKAINMQALNRVICVFVGYLFGLIQTGYIVGKSQNVDIREYGSGNSGTTNAMRTLGKKAGIITFLGDGIKPIVAIVITRIVFKDESDLFALVMYTGLGVVLGHNFPFYMKFKGGKGIAASAGVILALFDWKLLLLAALTFATVALISKYVSLASLVFMTLFTIELIAFGQLRLMSEWSKFNIDYNIECYIIAVIMTALAYIRHRQNIVRLINGTERKIGEKKEAI